MGESPNIQDYLNFREYLEAWREWQKENNPRFSQRFFARKACIPESNASYLSAVISGRRKLSESLRPLFAKALELEGRDLEYFDILVRFNQSGSLQAKNELFQQLSRFRASRAQIVHDEQFVLFSRWYLPVLWNWFAINKNCREPALIAKKIRPELAEWEVREGIEILVKGGFLVREANCYKVNAPHLTSGSDVQSIFIMQAMQQFASLGSRALEQIPSEQREFNALVFGCSPKGFEAIRERIRGMQEEFREIIDRDETEDSVYILNLQLFPVTQ
jgi:uncharacterized protein (TIGR02147 family)